MPDPLDAISATDKAVFARLSAGITGASVFQHVPQDTPVGAGLVIIGEMDDAMPLGSKGDRDREIPLTIIVLTEGEERAPCAAIAAKVEQLLGDATLIVPGWNIRPAFVQSSVSRAEEFEGYVGLVLFRVMALSE